METPTRTPLLLETGIGADTEPMLAMLHKPGRGGGVKKLGLVIPIGGPQIRSGAHRQYIDLADASAAAGFPTLRFDYPGLGDSPGEDVGFGSHQVFLSSAARGFLAEVPELTHLAFWGLCEGASTILLLNDSSLPIAGAILANPWLGEDGQDAGRLKHHYGARLLSWSFWGRVLRGDVNVLSAGLGLVSGVAQVIKQKIGGRFDQSKSDGKALDPGPLDLRARMREGAAQLEGNIFWILSGRDLTAKHFESFVKARPEWQSLVQSQNVLRLDEADHTFSDPSMKQRVNTQTVAWLETLWAKRKSGE
ncbi:MAG: hydrolase 1, exosortase A system-associated [Pseudomonadota bacterium]